MTTTTAPRRITPNTLAAEPAPAAPAQATNGDFDAFDVANTVADYAFPFVTAPLDTLDRAIGAARALAVVASADTSAGRLDVGETSTTELAVKGEYGSVYGQLEGKLAVEHTAAGYDVSASLKGGAGASIGGDKAELAAGGVVSATVTYSVPSAAAADAKVEDLQSTLTTGVLRAVSPSGLGGVGGMLSIASTFDGATADAKSVDVELGAKASAEFSLLELEGASGVAAGLGIALEGEGAVHMIVNNDNGKKSVSFEARAKVGAELAADVGTDNPLGSLSIGNKGGYDVSLVHRTTFPLTDDFDMAKATDLLAVKSAMGSAPGQTQIGVEVAAQGSKTTVEGKLFVEGGIHEALQVARAAVEGDPALAKGIAVTGEVTRSTTPGGAAGMKGPGVELAGSSTTTRKLETRSVTDGAGFLKEMGTQALKGILSVQLLPGT